MEHSLFAKRNARPVAWPWETIVCHPPLCASRALRERSFLVSALKETSLLLPGGGGGGGSSPSESEAKKTVCVPKISLQFSGPCDKFQFSPEENFSDVDGWVGRPGLARAPNNPPPPPYGVLKQ